MNKTELVDKIAAKTGLEKTKVALLVNAFLDTVTESLAKHESVTLIGFGSFKVKNRKARKGVNPKTRKPMTIPAANVPAISFGASTKEAVKTKKYVSKFSAKSTKAKAATTATTKTVAKKTAVKPVAKKVVAKKKK